MRWRCAVGEGCRMRPFGYAYGVWPTGERGCGDWTRTSALRLVEPSIYLLNYTAETEKPPRRTWAALVIDDDCAISPTLACATATGAFFTITAADWPGKPASAGPPIRLEPGLQTIRMRDVRSSLTPKPPLGSNPLWVFPWIAQNCIAHNRFVCVAFVHQYQSRP